MADIVIFDGVDYRVERSTGDGGPRTALETWIGFGLVGSERRWLGDRYSTTIRWWAAVNPTKPALLRHHAARGLHVPAGRGALLVEQAAATDEAAARWIAESTWHGAR